MSETKPESIGETIYRNGMVWIFAVAAGQDTIDILDEVTPLDEDPPRSRSLPYGRALGATSDGTTTNYGINFACTDTELDGYLGAGLATTIGLYYWRYNVEDGLLAATNHTASQAHLGESFGWPEALAALSLVVIVPPLDI